MGFFFGGSGGKKIKESHPEKEDLVIDILEEIVGAGEAKDPYKELRKLAKKALEYVKANEAVLSKKNVEKGTSAYDFLSKILDIFSMRFSEKVKPNKTQLLEVMNYCIAACEKRRFDEDQEALKDLKVKFEEIGAKNTTFLLFHVLLAQIYLSGPKSQYELPADFNPMPEAKPDPKRYMRAISEPAKIKEVVGEMMDMPDPDLVLSILSTITIHLEYERLLELEK